MYMYDRSLSKNLAFCKIALTQFRECYFQNQLDIAAEANLRQIIKLAYCAEIPKRRFQLSRCSRLSRRTWI